MSSSQRVEEYNKISDNFNRWLKYLIKILKSKFPDNISVERLSNRVSLVAQADPLYMITIAGEGIYTYRQQIRAYENPETRQHALDFFLQENFDEIEPEGEVTQQDIYDLVRMIKQAFQMGTPKEQDKAYNAVKNLLSDYCRFRVMQIEDGKMTDS